MQNIITDSGDVIYYVIRVNGAAVSDRFENSMLAEMEKQNLPEEMKRIAEIIPVTSDGKQMLLG